MDDHLTVIRHANRFEAIATDGFEGRAYTDRLEALALDLRRQGTLASGVATALSIMIDAIEESDPAGRFVRKVAILREAVGRLAL
jgi:hypothetical protein